MSGTSHLPKDSMSDDEYKRRYLERLSARLRDEGMQDEESAQVFACESWDSCPRAEMMPQYAADPELAADESYEEWRASGDDSEPDDEWDGDEDDWEKALEQF